MRTAIGFIIHLSTIIEMILTDFEENNFYDAQDLFHMRGFLEKAQDVRALS
ncbi:hypothetical protein [Pseudobdellovibrio exovorus]|uniref:hypothetical protein n=1 Tax=Pseudobdellovibrio exovorus TaxID=453816 RepID=UPI000349B852|nr:hypothetical protein [Pseudobdellovibrio exovorus]